MKAVVDQPFGDVSGPDAVLRLQPVAKDNLMHRPGLVGQFVDAVELFTNVVRIQDSIFRRLPQTIRTIGEYVGKSTDEHAEVAVEGAHASDRLWPVVLEAE